MERSKNFNETDTTARAKSLRATETKSERLLWSVLRARQLCNLKFRRQYPIPPYYADFACLSPKTVVEIDGDCHDSTGVEDLKRQAYLEKLGWKVIRFSDKEVEDDVDAVAQGIARELGMEFEFNKRPKTGSGMKSQATRKKRANTNPPLA